MAEPIHAFDFLAGAPPTQAYYALVGDEAFLTRQVLRRLLASRGGENTTELEGNQAEWRDVVDELDTVSLFGDGPRLVILRQADDFVSKHRAHLESRVGRPSGSGCLVLELRMLPSNTRLFKLWSEHGQIVQCQPPQTKRGRGGSLDENRLRAWLREWSESAHGVRLQRGADEELLELTGPELGLLDQELAKLALFLPSGGAVTVELVKQVVGGWRAQTSWDLLEAALDGNAGEALLQLQRLLQAGEAPQAIAGAVFWSLRRFADAAQLVLEAEQAGRKIALTAALEQAGIKKWPTGALQRAERQLRQLGRERAGELYQRLLDLDLSMKGSHSSPPRTRWALERLLVSLARQAAPPRPATRV